MYNKLYLLSSLFIFVTLLGCEPDKEEAGELVDLTGEWMVVKASRNGEPPSESLAADMFFFFGKDGTYASNFNSDTELKEGSYKQEGDKITATLAQETFEFITSKTNNGSPKLSTKFKSYKFDFVLAPQVEEETNTPTIDTLIQ